MVTFGEFLGELLTSLFDLGRIFTFDVALRGDPLAFLLWVVGALITAFSVAVFGYLSLGAVGGLFNLGSPSSRRQPPHRD